MNNLLVVGAVVAGTGFGIAKYMDKGIDFNPGLWESTTTVSSNLMETQTNTTTECMTADSLDPEKLTENMVASVPTENCSYDSDTSEGEVWFDMSCDMDDRKIEANGYFSYTDTEGEASMQLQMDIGGQEITLDMESTSTRVGDC